MLFTYQSPLTAVAVNSVSPHELAFGTSDSVIYVMDRRKLGIVISSSTAAQSVISKMSAGVDRQPHQITSLQFSPEGDQILASYSGDSVYLFDVKVTRTLDLLCSPNIFDVWQDPSTVIPMSDPVLKLEESFSIAKPRNLQNFKRIRLRGDWSDTGPSAGTEQTSPTQNSKQIVLVNEKYLSRAVSRHRYRTSSSNRPRQSDAAIIRCVNINDAPHLAEDHVTD